MGAGKVTALLMGITVGLDGTRGGWVAVALRGGEFLAARLLAGAPEALSQWPKAEAYGIDIPIGLVDATRHADAAARAALGRRGSTVFPAPCATALAQETYAEANVTQRRLVAAGLSKQAYMLKERIVDAARVAKDPRVHEIHPELAFARIAGEPLPPKRTWAGMRARIRWLGHRGVTLPEDLGDVGRAPVDDVLDAAVVALAAKHVREGTARKFPASPQQRDAQGRLIVIWG